MIAESRNNNFTEKSQMANAVRVNQNWGLRTSSRTLKNTAILVEDWALLASDRPDSRATIHRPVEEFESNWIKHQQLKLVIRKDGFKYTNIQSGEVRTCSVWGRLCLSMADLVRHLRKLKDTVPSATRTCVCLRCGRFFRSLCRLKSQLRAISLLGACKWKKTQEMVLFVR